MGTELQSSGRHFALGRGEIASEVFLLFSWIQEARIDPKKFSRQQQVIQGEDEGAERGTFNRQVAVWRGRGYFTEHGGVGQCSLRKSGSSSG